MCLTPKQPNLIECLACVLCRSISEENTGNLFENSQQLGGIVAEKIHSLLLLYREREREGKEAQQSLKKTDPTTSQQRNESEQRRDSVITLLSFE